MTYYKVKARLNGDAVSLRIVAESIGEALKCPLIRP